MIFRKPSFSDVEMMLEVINDYAGQGLMLSKSRNAIYENLRDFVLAEEDGKIVGVAGLHLVWNELGEIRSLAVVKDGWQKGVGRRLVEILTDEAKELGVKHLFALTYQQGFFEKMGFKVVAKETVPQKMWKECIDCPKFPNCDEIAMIKEI
ncbi:MAG: N-acetyltransferase [Sporomusaceae bacterium]|nr:N-acetyltransferase [Sporomusaceae bacterium]